MKNMKSYQKHILEKYLTYPWPYKMYWSGSRTNYIKKKEMPHPPLPRPLSGLIATQPGMCVQNTDGDSHTFDTAILSGHPVSGFGCLMTYTDSLRFWSVSHPVLVF